jgi:hypothetical protein
VCSVHDVWIGVRVAFRDGTAAHVATGTRWTWWCVAKVGAGVRLLCTSSRSSSNSSFKTLMHAPHLRCLVVVVMRCERRMMSCCAGVTVSVPIFMWTCLSPYLSLSCLACCFADTCHACCGCHARAVSQRLRRGKYVTHVRCYVASISRL